MHHVWAIKVILYGWLLPNLPWVDAALHLGIVRKCRDAVNKLQHPAHGYRGPDATPLSILDNDMALEVDGRLTPLEVIHGLGPLPGPQGASNNNITWPAWPA